MKSFLVDYSWLGPLKSRTKPLSYYRGHDDRLAELAGKIVLLGQVKGAPIEDAFVVPGEKDPVAGVYLHACAAATLAKAPIWRFSPFARMTLDILLGILAVLWFTLVNLRARPAGPGRPDTELLPAFGLVAVSTFLAGLALSQFRLFWPDFYMAAILIGLHPLVDWVAHALPSSFARYGGYLLRTVGRAWRPKETQGGKSS